MLSMMVGVVCYRIPNKKFNKDKKQLAFCSLRSLILANHFLPVNRALVRQAKLGASYRVKDPVR